ncbi:hypothetical protein ACFWXA_13165 [Streptomyces atroolivaceus]|uniref:hypothetical protein n=1 Tax=Streptomyces atroolivaceus TaxID=66869 RepID=UPI00365DDA6F
MSGGIVRTPQDIGETQDCGPLPTRADTVRTRPDTACPDTEPGVRFAYRATVPRHLVGAAFAEAFTHLADELHPLEPAPPASTERRAEIAAAVADAFDLPPDILRKDPRT